MSDAHNGKSRKLDEMDDVYAQIKAIMSEHFEQYMFIVMDDEGDLYYDYNNVRIGRMLLKETSSEMESELSDLEVCWFDEDEEDE
jgi:hypothetical protein